MALINLFDVSLAFGGPNLLERIGFRVQPGERVCLLGRNGAGKSSLLKVLAGTIPPDSGEISREAGLETGYLPQDVPSAMEGEVYEVAAQELGSMGETLIDLRRGQGGEQSAEQGNEQRLCGWRTAVCAPCSPAWAWSPDQRVETLSGGLQAPGAAWPGLLAKSPQLLLLDEPTNHLDIQGYRVVGGVLGRTTRGPWSSSPTTGPLPATWPPGWWSWTGGCIYDWNCPYDEFLRRREEALVIEQEQRAKLRQECWTQEEAWLHRGLRARRTRDEGRVRRLHARCARSGPSAARCWARPPCGPSRRACRARWWPSSKR